MLSLVVLLALATAGVAQDVDPSPASRPEPGRSADDVTGVAAYPEDPRRLASELPEGPIDPEVYRVGPGDRFRVVVWGAAGFALDVAIGPEGSLYLPDVGVLDLRGATLAEARQRVRRAILDVYSSVEVELILSRLRRFKVHVVGEVQAPGSYPASAVTRASDVVVLAGGFTSDASRRAIRMRARDGATTLVDLVGQQFTGRLDLDPFVSDGAIIEVPRRTESVLLSGSVVRPGYYEPLPGERLSGLLDATGGLTPGADSASVTLSHFVTDRESEDRTFRYRPGGGELADPTLANGDRVFVRQIPDFLRPAQVFVYGAVRHPGRFPVPVSGAPLSEVIALAGGFTSRANLPQAHILRGRQPHTPSGQMVDRSAYNIDRGQFEYASAQAALDTVLVACDFVALFEKDDRSQDVTLRNGDVVEIPEDRGEVRVVGLVRQPGSYPHADGLSVADYVARAGGYDREADKGRTRLARFEGGPLRKAGDRSAVASGSVIYVPPRERKSFLDKTREYAGFIIQLASLVVVIESLAR